MNEKRRQKIVVIGGGTGSFVVLSGLKKYPVDLTAIVTVTDDGGSTGRLRDEFGFLPAGDMRQCLAALSDTKQDGYLKDLLLYRFAKGEKGLRGHNLGNLILTALEDITGSESAGLQAASHIFRLKGKVLPVSLELVKLVAEYQSGKRIVSEHKIEENKLGKNDRIIKLTTQPSASINPAAKKAILSADLIILGPGDLYGSTIANLVVGGVPVAIGRSRAKIIHIVNLMTLCSQTNGFKVSDHVKELERYLGKKVSYIMLNNEKIPNSVLKLYAHKGEYPVVNDMKQDKRVVEGSFLSNQKINRSSSDPLQRSLIRHSSDKLAEKIIKLL
jgi:uncharacterized cofD-like protein